MVSGAKKLSLRFKTKPNVEITTPARTRFAPSPTGFVHLGSLRTALYNYLLAKSTGGQFLLRLEDTDQKRLVPGAEENIYDSLKWCGLNWDEGPITGGPYGPYRQSDRSQIYKEHVDQLLESGHAYRCFCSKERMDSLRESAKLLQPPTTVTYDRKCYHLSPEEVQQKLDDGESFVVRFKTPQVFPKFNDLLHGEVNIQPQVNNFDVRYDDQVLMKSDGLPTYHFANVVDDHLMKITHVIRGEEWLSSTPKHIALYHAFNWKEPAFIHLPLLTNDSSKKLSKRAGDIDVTNFRNKHYLPEALVNFVALFGWSSPKVQSQHMDETYDLNELTKIFTINKLAKGNAKVDYKKLDFFNKFYLQLRFKNHFDETFDETFKVFTKEYPHITKQQLLPIVKEIYPHFTFVSDVLNFKFLFQDPVLENKQSSKFLTSNDKTTVIEILEQLNGSNINSVSDLNNKIHELQEQYDKILVFKTVRLALSGLQPGLNLHVLIELLGFNTCIQRINSCIKYLSTCT